MSTDGTDVTVSWTPVVNTHWTPNPALTYQVYKGDATLGDPVTSTSTVDSAFSAEDYLDTQYRVAALLDGVAARTGSPDMLGVPQVTAAVAEDLDEADATVGGLTLTLSRPLLSGESVTATYDVTAQGGAATIDATDFNETFTFGAGGNNTATASGNVLAIPLTAKADMLYEADQSNGILVTITALKFRPDRGNADGSDDVDIIDSLPSGTVAYSLGFAEDDTLPTTIVLSVNPTSIGEGAGTTGVTVTASFPPGSGALGTATDLLIDIGGTATPNDDYALAIGGGGTLTVRIPIGATSGSHEPSTVTVTVTPVNDDDSEGDETIVFSVDTPPAGFDSVTPATLTIVDDDISAVISSPSSLTERTLNGAQLTVDLVGTQYVSGLTPGDFSFQPQGVLRDLSVASVSRVSNTRAVLTLSFRGDIDSDVDLQVVVDGSAHTGSALPLTTAGVTVTEAPPPGQVTGVTVTGRPGSLEVSWNTADNADGYQVVWWESEGEFSLDNTHRVSGGSNTRTTIGGLPGETGFSVQVAATSNFNPTLGDYSAIATGTTLPGHAIVSATDPSPLTERNLYGATLTVDLLPGVYDPWAPRLDDDRAKVTVSGVPGVTATIADVTRVSDERMLVRLSYDGTDFDTDRLLRVEFYLAHTGIETITAVAEVVAVDEPPPGPVTNLTATGGVL